jgi:transcription elongation factor GreA
MATTVVRTPRTTALALTDDGRRLLERRLQRLRKETLVDLGSLLSDPRRDERLVSDFERLLGEADEIEALLAAADRLPDPDPRIVQLGSRVVIELSDGTRERLRIVHPAEAFLDDERVSCESPVAVALLGARVGQTVVVHAPAGIYSARVMDLVDVAAVA